jgi:RNA polymerase primary sigma factor
MSAVIADALPDSVDLFMNEAKHIPLLSKEQERDLAQRIAEGSMTARDQFVAANIRLVVAVAQSYHGTGLPLADRIAEGNIGLLRAVEKFDYTKGFKFSTYATWWIRQAIDRACKEQGRLIDIPVHVVKLQRRLGRMTAYLRGTLNREPTTAEVAEALGWEEENVLAVRQIVDDPISLDVPVDDTDEATLGDLLPSVTPATDDEAAALERARRLRHLIALLPSRTRTILEMRFGLDGEGGKTLEEIGRVFGLNRERIRQIEAKALAHLRERPEAQAWLDDLIHTTHAIRPARTLRLPSQKARATVTLPKQQRPFKRRVSGEPYPVAEYAPAPAITEIVEESGPPEPTPLPAEWHGPIGVVSSVEMPAEPSDTTPDVMEKACKKCGETKPLADFDRHTGFKSGYDSACKTCRHPRKATQRRSHKHVETTPAEAATPITTGIMPPPLVDLSLGTPATIHPQFREKFWQQVNVLDTADLSLYALTWHEMEVIG